VRRRTTQGTANSWAKANGAQHFIWSTPPDVEIISKAAFEVPHFTGKAKVDEPRKVRDQNTSVQPVLLSKSCRDDGSTAKTRWHNRLDTTDWPHKKKQFTCQTLMTWEKWSYRCVFCSLKVGNSTYLQFATELNSFTDTITLATKPTAKQHSFFTGCWLNCFSTFEGAKGTRWNVWYFWKHTLHGACLQSRIELAKGIATSMNLCRSRNGWSKTIKQMKPSWATTKKTKWVWSPW